MSSASTPEGSFGLPNAAATIDSETQPRPQPEKVHIILATTGSVASVKAPLIVEELLKYKNALIQIVATESSLHFYDVKAIEEVSQGRVRVWRDADEWAVRQSRSQCSEDVTLDKLRGKTSDPILHIELRRWADLVLVAPCSANSLAKIANGICDNLLTSLLRALDMKRTPAILFPAMNTQMYLHPLTDRQLHTVKNVIGYEVVGPISKTIACGDIGIGGMTEWRDIVQLVVARYKLTKA